MQEYEDLRKQKQEEYAAQRRRRIELRNSKSINYILTFQVSNASPLLKMSIRMKPRDAEEN